MSLEFLWMLFLLFVVSFCVFLLIGRILLEMYETKKFPFK